MLLECPTVEICLQCKVIEELKRIFFSESPLGGSTSKHKYYIQNIFTIPFKNDLRADEHFCSASFIPYLHPEGTAVVKSQTGDFFAWNDYEVKPKMLMESKAKQCL